MTADELYRAGRLDEAIEAVGVEVRASPLDARRRTFLLDLLCFAGDYARAEKQLDALARGGPQEEMSALLYRSALHAERTRQEMFRTTSYAVATTTRLPVAGTLNGRPFESLVDADARLGARLEMFVAGQYTWMPLEHVASVRMERPKRLRDLLWAPAMVRAGPAFRGAELGEVLLPVLAPLTWQSPSDAVRLGRRTEWTAIDGEQLPVGQKMFLVDDEEIPLLEVRELDIAPVPAATA